MRSTSKTQKHEPSNIPEQPDELTPELTVDLEALRAAQIALGRSEQGEPPTEGEPTGTFPEASINADTQTKGEPVVSPAPNAEELMRQRISVLEREVFEMRATLQNIVPVVTRGIPTGEVLFYLQSLDQRIMAIERYLQMITSN